MKFTYYSYSEDDTVMLGKAVGERLHGGDILAFRGGLGAGKTAMTRGIAAGMGLSDDVSSPTFTLVNEYLGRLNLYHFDMYRIPDSSELDSIGFFDYFSDDAVLAIEWSENISDVLPENTVVIDIEPLDENLRKITVDGDERFEFKQFDAFGN